MGPRDRGNADAVLPTLYLIIPNSQGLLRQERTRLIDFVDDSRLNRVDVGFGLQLDFSTASTQVGSDIPFTANEIASFLLSQEYFRFLIIKASQKEKLLWIILELLKPLIRRYGQELRKVACESLHIIAARELIKQSPYITSAILKISNADPFQTSSTETDAWRVRIEALLQYRRLPQPESSSPKMQPDRKKNNVGQNRGRNSRGRTGPKIFRLR